MKVKKAVVWSIVASHGRHPSVTSEEMEFRALAPLIRVLFPGIGWFSITGAYQMMEQLVIPALRKQHPGLADQPSSQVAADAMVIVSEALPCRGYEWQDSVAWRARFQSYLDA